MKSRVWFRIFAVSSCLLTLGLASACRSLRGMPSSPVSIEGQRTEVTFTLGTVRQVRSAMNYVVLECTSLPFQGERLTVYRDGAPVAQVQVNGPVKMPYATADIVDGTPAIGDKVKAVRTRMTDSAERGLL